MNDIDDKLDAVEKELSERSFAMDLLTEFKLVNKRQFWIILALILMLVGTNMAWLWTFTQYDYVEYIQDGEGYNNINLNNGGDVFNNNGAEGQDKNQEIR